MICDLCQTDAVVPKSSLCTTCGSTVATLLRISPALQPKQEPKDIAGRSFFRPIYTPRKRKKVVSIDNRKNV